MDRRLAREANSSIRNQLGAVTSGEKLLSVFFFDDSAGLIRSQLYSPGQLLPDQLDDQLHSLQELFGRHVARIDVTAEMAERHGETVFFDPAWLYAQRAG